MNNIQFYFGYPVEFKQLCLIYPPTVKEVVTTKNYTIYERMLTMSQEEMEDEYTRMKLDIPSDMGPFEYILNNGFNNAEFKQLLEQAFTFFIHEPVTFLFDQKEIVIGDIREVKAISELRILKETDYFDFQNIIREACGRAQVKPPDPNLNPKIKALKAKARYRDYVKMQKGQGLNLEEILTSIFFMNIGITPLNIGELSYSIVPHLLEVYQNKEKYDTDIAALLAGADSKKIKPKYWMKNVD